MMESLMVKDLCKTYIVNKRQNNVLRNINMEIKQGEMMCHMGNGGGHGAQRIGEIHASLYGQRDG